MTVKLNAEQAKGLLMKRKGVVLRLLMTLFFMIVFEFLRSIVYLTTVVQFLIVIVTEKEHKGLQGFSNRVASYAYQILRYITLNDNKKPYPFGDFPKEMEPPVDTVEY